MLLLQWIALCSQLIFNSRKSFYLDYLFGLNYWITNTLFIVIIVSIFLGKFFRSFSFIFLNFFIKIKTMSLFFVKKQLPNALFFGTIVIHPILYYLLTTVFVIKFVRLNCRNSTSVVPIINFFLVNLLIITLLLGGLWGLQSTVWGYFWVNDSVEWLLLVVILYVITKLHIFNEHKVVYNKFILIFGLLNIVLIIRLNIFQTRHSFIEQQSLILIIILIYNAILKKFWRYKHFNSCKSNVYATKGFIIYFLLTIVIILGVGVLLVKYLFIVFTVFFLNQTRPGFLLSKSYLHLYTISFFYAWNIYFTFFFLFYEKTQIILAESPQIFNSMVIYLKYFTKKVSSFALLENVTFSISQEFCRCFNLVSNTLLFIKLNNVYLIALLIFFFSVKMFEFRLLYATKTSV